MLISELAQLCNARPLGGDGNASISSAADIMSAQHEQVTVLSDGKYKKHLKDCQASACFISEALLDEGVAPAGMTLLVGDDPEMSFLTAVSVLHPEPPRKKQVSPQAALAADVKLGQNIHIGPFSSIGEGSSLGDETVVEAGVHIGRNVAIGRNCRLHPDVVIYDNTVIGDNVTIHAGSIIGADGFGYKYRNNQHVKVPHVGNVVIDDNVEIGANTCIDRGALGATRIGWGSKIDNLVQLGHNNIVGRNVIVCGQCGISGSCEIGDGAILAGSVGVADHVKIGSRAVVMARSGVSQDIDPGSQVWGSPAKDRKVIWRELAALAKLPELLQIIKNLESRLNKLEEKS
ncbi:UDP-3-O-(3-hydroxymyristoyl)glucosamine N-acyltransferase [Methylomonas sp. MgM2]